MAGKKPPENVVCLECRHAFTAVPKLTFLGLPKYRCPMCSKESVYPLSVGRRTGYLIGSVIIGVFMIALLIRGVVPLPGVLPIGMQWALKKDREVRNGMQRLGIEPSTV